MIKTPTFQRPRRRGALIEPRPALWDCGADLLEADVHREAAGRGLRRLVVETTGGPGEWRSHGDFLWILNGFFMDFYDFEWISMIFDGCFYDFERSFHWFVHNVSMVYPNMYPYSFNKLMKFPWDEHFHEIFPRNFERWIQDFSWDSWMVNPKISCYFWFANILVLTQLDVI